MESEKDNSTQESEKDSVNPLSAHAVSVGEIGPTGGKPRKDPRTKERAIVPLEKRRKMLEFTSGLLSKKGETVVKKVLEVALNDKHPGQLQALKLCLDRIAPTSFFEEAHKRGESSKIEVQVTIQNPNEPKVIDAEDVVIVDSDGKDS